VARLDTHWHAHPRILPLGLEGMGLHAWGISYCDAELTDGFIPTGALPGLPRVKQAVNRLLELGRWEIAEGGYRVHNYLRYNRSRQQVLTDRAEAKERMNRGRRSPDVRPNISRNSSEVQENFARGSDEVQPLPVPVPVPGTGEDAAAAAAPGPASRPRAREDAPMHSLGSLLARLERLDHAPDHVEAERDRQRQQRQQNSFSETTGETA
jgi:hypothetical protein